MYICSCFAVTDGQIKQSVASGTRTFRELCQELKCCTNCGICAVHAKEVFDKAKAEQANAGDQKDSS